MKMVKLEIKNYECWKDQTLDFSLKDGSFAERGGFFGKAGTGKSTATRAIRWCIHGDLGEDFELKKPNTWKDGWEENQFVRITYITDDSKQIIITRIRKKESPNETQREIRINGKSMKDSGVVNHLWQKYFGIAPKSQRDVDWYIKPKTMTDTYKKITDRSKMQAKLLSLTSISDLISRILDVDEQISNDIQQLNKNIEGGSELNKSIGVYNTEIDDLKKKMRENEKELEKIDEKLESMEEDSATRQARISLYEKKEELGSNLTTALAEFAEARIEFRGIIKKPSKLIPTIAYAILKDSGLSEDLPDESFIKANKYDLDQILEKFGDAFSEDSKEGLKKIIDGSESEFKGVALYTASEYADSIHETVQDFKNAIIANEEAKVAVNEIEAKILGMSKADHLADQLSETNVKELLNQRDDYKGENEQHEIDIEHKEELRNDLLTKQSENTQDGGTLLKYIRMQNVSNNLLKDLREGREKFTQEMFKSMVKDIKEAWRAIDGGSTGYEIEFREGDNARIVLVWSDDKEIMVELDSSEEDGSGKSSSGMFGMACLSMAMAKLSYLDLGLPILLDDATTFLDLEKEERALQLISKKFGQVIYVANRLTKEHIDGLQVEFRFELDEKTKERTIKKVII